MIGDHCHLTELQNYSHHLSLMYQLKNGCLFNKNDRKVLLIAIDYNQH